MDAELATKTEVFEAAASDADCAICQDAIQCGIQVRAIRACGHSFHTACVDPWLITNGTCPMCRAPVVTLDAREESEVDRAMRMLTEIATQLQTQPDVLNSAVFQQSFNAIRTEVSRLTGVDINEFRRSTRRLALTYWVVTGILRKYKTAAAYRQWRSAIEVLLVNTTIDSVRPLTIDTTTIASLKRRKAELTQLLITRLPGVTQRGIEKHTILVGVQTRIRSAAVFPLRSHLQV